MRRPRGGIRAASQHPLADASERVMGKQTKIEWTDSTWNPTRGCSRVSEGCRNCYAEAIATRFAGDTTPEGFARTSAGRVGTKKGSYPFSGFAILTDSGPRWTGKVELIESKLLEPLHWK